VRELEARVREVERLLAARRWRSRLLKEAGAAARRKNRAASAVATTRRFPVKVAADTLGVARSNLVQRMQGSTIGCRLLSGRIKTVLVFCL
jgi:hypothetical protein